MKDDFGICAVSRGTSTGTPSPTLDFTVSVGFIFADRAVSIKILVFGFFAPPV